MLWLNRAGVFKGGPPVHALPYTSDRGLLLKFIDNLILTWVRSPWRMFRYVRMSGDN